MSMVCLESSFAVGVNDVSGFACEASPKSFASEAANQMREPSPRFVPSFEF